MTDQNFEEIIRNIKKPVGKILSDWSTYRISGKDLAERLPEKYGEQVKNFDKILLLTASYPDVPEDTVVGAVLFYDNYAGFSESDIQVHILKEYRGKGYLTKIHKNGVLKKELYPNQEVTIAPDGIESMEDLEMKIHLLSLIHLKPDNLDHIKRYAKELFAQDL